MTRLLVVEDDFLIRLTLIDGLTDEGFECVDVDGPKAALAALEADQTIDLAITDLALGADMDGLALADAMRVSRPDLPVLFVTGRPDRVETLSPIDAVIPKPYLPSEIARAVRALLARTNDARR